MIEVISKQEDFKERLHKEYIDLGAKINRLESFIYHNDKFESLDIKRQELLVAQLKVMKKYLSILADRMDIEEIAY